MLNLGSKELCNPDLPALLREIIDIESVSGNEEKLADAVFSTLAKAKHLHLSRIGNVIIAKTELGRKKRVIIAGHLDTVPIADNFPSWETKDLIFGRGACDMKGGVAVAIAAALVLDAPKYDLTWLFYDNEEVEAEKNGLNKLVQEQPELLAADFAILMEPTSAQIEGGCQGTLRFVVKLVGKAAHSARSWLGDNAIHKAKGVLEILENYQARSVIVDGLKYREGLNAVKISGGIAGNVIPDAASVTINFRFAPDRDENNAKQHILQLFSGYDLEFTDFAAGARPGLDREIVQEFVALVPNPPRAKYGWTDVARFSALNIPAVNFGPADPNLAHTRDEHCPKTDLEICYQALVNWLGKEAE